MAVAPPSAPADRRLGHRPALDGLRGVAILLVVGHHVGALLLPAAWGPDLLPAGFLGVDVFFVLSGFLITTLLLERSGEPARGRRFYGRRALRLLPAVGVLLAVAVVVAVAAGEPAVRTANTVLVVATYTTNWAGLQGIEILAPLTHLWSLAVEEQFYLVWPALVWGALALGAGRRAILALALALAATSALWRLGLWQQGDLGVQLYFRSDTRADGLLLGAALACVSLARLEAVAARAGSALAGAGALAVAVAAQGAELGSAWLYLGGFTLLAVATVALIVAGLGSGTVAARTLGARPLAVVGVLSYGLYLWHYPVFTLVHDHLGGLPWPGRVAIGLGVTAAVTVASRRWIELPALAVRRRWADGRAGT